MPADHIPIELDETGFSGLVRQEPISGKSLPGLIAHRPEPWRFLRLARIVGAAQAIADRELGGHDASVLIESLLSMSDFKGDFTVIWRLPTHNEGFEKVVDRALALMGEDEVLHLLESDQ